MVQRSTLKIVQLALFSTLFITTALAFSPLRSHLKTDTLQKANPKTEPLRRHLEEIIPAELDDEQ